MEFTCNDSKFAFDVYGCLSFRVSPAVDWQPVQGEPRLLPYDSWDRPQPPPCENRWISGGRPDCPVMIGLEV